MADRYLKLSYDIYVTFVAGDYYPTIGSSLSADKFIIYPRYYMMYGIGDISGQLLLPDKLRMYQQQVIFHDRILLDVMTAGKRNRAIITTTPDSIANINFDPSSSDLEYISELGTENSYSPQHADGYCHHVEIDMQNQKASEVSGTATITFNAIYIFHDNETTEYNALLTAYPNNVTPYNPNADPWSIDRTGLYLPYRTEFPEMYEYNGVSPWYIDNTGLNLPYHVEFPEMHDYYYEKPWYIDNTGENLPYREEFPDMPELPKRYTDPAPPASWFSFKGQKCTEFGCILEKLPLNIRNELNTKIIDMPNNTPFVQDPSGWKTKVITVTLGLKNTSNATIDAINSWLIGQGELIFSDDPDRHYIATCNGTLTGNRLLRLGKLPVQFTLMPYKRNNEEDFIEYEPDENSAVFIENKGTAFCEPEIVIYGTGDIALAHTESGTVIHITGVTDQCTISVPKRKVFDENNNVILSQVSGDITELKLAPKTINEITFSSNVTKVEVKLNERWL